MRDIDWKSWFSFRGRLGRRGYWLGLALTLVANVLLSPLGPAGAPLSFVVAWVQFALMARRLHDVGQSGWWQAPALLLGIWATLRAIDPSTGRLQPSEDPIVLAGALLYMAFIVVMGSVRGQAGPNRFGEAPAASRP